jgi:hypothetical protein
MSRVLVTIAIATSLVVTAGPAAAAAPDRQLPTAFEVDIDFPDICSFPLTAHVEGRTLSLTFDDRGFAGGQLFVTWTRLDTGESLRLAIPGPTFFDALGIAVRGAGRWTTPMEGVGWVLAAGNLTFEGTEGGFALIATMTGSSTSLCEVLG